MYQTKKDCKSRLVLIDTWWNVNSGTGYRSQSWIFGFNRYMVECEFYLMNSLFPLRIQVLIDTWWNVNLVTWKTLRSCLAF